MSARISVTFESGEVVEVPDLPISAGRFTSEAILQALPSVKGLISALREDPEAAAELVNNYLAGRVDAAKASAERLGVVDRRAGVEPDSVFFIIIVIIIIIVVIQVIRIIKSLQ